MMRRRHIRGPSSGEATGAGEPHTARRGAHRVLLPAADRALLRRLAAVGRLEAPAGLRSRILARCTEEWSSPLDVQWFPVVRDLVAAAAVLLAVLLTGEIMRAFPAPGNGDGRRLTERQVADMDGLAQEAVGDAGTRVHLAFSFHRFGVPADWIRMRRALLESLVEGRDASGVAVLSGGG